MTDELDDFRPFDAQRIPADPFEVLRLMNIVNILVAEAKKRRKGVGDCIE